LSNILDKRESKIDEARELLKLKIDDLEKLENKLSITPKITFYE
jgi:hypothetical protein